MTKTSEMDIDFFEKLQIIWLIEDKENEIKKITDFIRQREMEECENRHIGKFLAWKPLNKRVAL